MKVILLEDIRGLGKKFEVKEVRNGYAKNFLIPNNLAKAATGTNLKEIEREKSIWEAKEKETIEYLKRIANQLEGIALDFSLKVGDNGQTFGSVTVLEIEKALENLGIFQKFSKKIKKIEVLLEKPIKELGEYLVQIDLGKGIKSKIKVKVHSQP